MVQNSQGAQRNTVEQAVVELRRIAPGLPEASEAALRHPIGGHVQTYLPPPFTLNPKEHLTKDVPFQSFGADPKLPCPVPSALDYGVPIQAFPGPLPPPSHMLLSPLPPNTGF